MNGLANGIDNSPRWGESFVQDGTAHVCRMIQTGRPDGAMVKIICGYKQGIPTGLIEALCQKD